MRPELLLELILVLLLLEAMYQFGVSLFGMRSARPAPRTDTWHRFAIFIPAHDEESVIGANVRSLREMSYPADRYEVFVIADHCQDETARVAAEEGATVLERSVGPRDGKPGALSWAWTRLGDRLQRFDAVVIVDADNIVASNFLSVMNRHLAIGERLVQANLDVKNPDTNWITKAISVAYWSTSRSHQLARHGLGWCAALGGTGICIDRPLLEKLGWNVRCLTEDLDFQARALIEGVRTSWAHEARVYDEKPATLRASVRQRLRWMRGHMSVAVAHSGALVRAAWRRASWTCADATLYLWQPYKLAIGFTALSIWSLWSWLGDPQFALPGAVVATFATFYVFHLAQYLFWGVGFLALLRERVPLRYYVYYLHALVLGATWVLVVFAAMLRPRGAWTPTRHSAQIEIGQRLALDSARARPSYTVAHAVGMTAAVVLVVGAALFAVRADSYHMGARGVVWNALHRFERLVVGPPTGGSVPTWETQPFGWVDRFAVATEPGAENLVYYYYDPERGVGELPSAPVTAFAILRYLDIEETERAVALGEGLRRCQEPKRSGSRTAGAFSHAVVRTDAGWEPSGFCYTGDNLAVLEAYLALHDATGDSSYVEIAVEIGDWLLQTPYRGTELGMWVDDVGAPLHLVTRDGAYENSVRPHLLWLWLPSLERLSEITGDARYRKAMRRTVAFLRQGISPDGPTYSLYDPGFPARPYHPDRWRFHPGNKIITDELLLSALGMYRLGYLGEARNVLRFLSREGRGAYYAYLNPDDGGPKFAAADPSYFDVVASCLVDQLARALREEELSADALDFLESSLSENGGWYWGLRARDLRPVESKQATLINLWATSGELPGILRDGAYRPGRPPVGVSTR